ncbi:hypothetical protein CCP4SC76_2420002 [Gammaproteobacteria bacterium]
MQLSDESKTHLESIARDTLSKLDVVAKTALDALNNTPQRSLEELASSFGYVNTFTSNSSIQNLKQIDQAKQKSYQVLAREPAIARIVVIDNKDERQTYYICRTTPISGIPNMASYLAPLGRLASLPIGTEFQLPNGTSVVVIEQTQLYPIQTVNDWDSQNSVVESDSYGPVTIESLRALLQQIAGEELVKDLLDKILAEEDQTDNIKEGIRRNIITKMSLRDQPVLDQYQDEIFRLPLDKRLLILGPPGTGKTTTLIRRLGQKLDSAFLTEDEKHIIGELGAVNNTAHVDSWLMFTPTELLKLYLKEAFARENVPASDHRIKTW